MRCGFPVQEVLCTLQEPSVHYNCLYQLEVCRKEQLFVTEFTAVGKVTNIDEIGEVVN